MRHANTKFIGRVGGKIGDVLAEHGDVIEGFGCFPELVRVAPKPVKFVGIEPKLFASWYLAPVVGVDVCLADIRS